MVDLVINTDRFKRFWRNRLLRGADFADHHERLNALYHLKDPWGFTDPREQMRFQETNRILLREFGRVETLLEIGCAEGHQTVHLMRVCRQLYGIDVSARAVRRAKRKCHGAILAPAGFPTHIRGAPERFDVVVACEVLYFVKDVSLTLRQMRESGRQGCLVTYYHGSSYRERLDHVIADFPCAGQEIIRCDDRSWSAVWWRND
jgi:hypothetical protein